MVVAAAAAKGGAEGAARRRCGREKKYAREEAARRESGRDRAEEPDEAVSALFRSLSAEQRAALAEVGSVEEAAVLGEEARAAGFVRRRGRSASGKRGAGGWTPGAPSMKWRRVGEPKLRGGAQPRGRRRREEGAWAAAVEAANARAGGRGTVELGEATLPSAAPRRYRQVSKTWAAEAAEAEVDAALWLAAIGDEDLPDGCSLHGTYGVKFDLAAKTRACLDVWKAHGAVPVVLRWIADGYDLDWLDGPPERWACYGNHTGALEPEEHLNFLRAQLPELMQMGAVRVARVKPWLVSPFNVVPKATKGKFRLILDLRKLNEALKNWKFKMETLKTHREIFRKGRWMVGVDLKSGYHCIGIREEDRKYFGCELDGVFYEWTALPFGLSSAPFVFTKAMRQLSRYFREECGYDLVQYIDDWCFVFDTKREAELASAHVKSTFEKWGLTTCPKKSTWTPTQKMKMLGFVIDLEQGVFVVPEERRERILAQARVLAETDGRVAVREVAKFVGRVVSCGLVLGPVAVRWARALYRVIETRSSWKGTVVLSEAAKEECRFWLRWFPELDACEIHPGRVVIQCVGSSDASDFASGRGYDLDSADGRTRLARELLEGEDEALESSTLRELWGIHRSLVALVKDGSFDGETIQWRMDSQAAWFILMRGSGKAKLDSVGKDIWGECVRRRIRLLPLWVPREKNKFSDLLSKIQDGSDWAVADDVFEEIDAAWGPHTVDRFASYLNKKCKRFNARWYCRDAEAVDALVQDWSGETNWVNPPFGILDRVLGHMRRGRYRGTVLVPDGRTWSSQPWFTAIFGPRRPEWLLERRPLAAETGTFLRGGIEPMEPPAWSVWACKVDFGKAR